MQHTLSVLHTLRSRECWTAAANRSASASGAATSQAPPVPCRLTGTPCWRATAPSWATAAPEPRATASASRPSANSAQPAAWAGESTSCTAPAGSPAAASAGASACSTIARAVPNASLPMRKTTVLPVRSTPVASAKTFGRPSKTKPTTPSGLRHASTDQPSWAWVATRWARRVGLSRHVRRPSIIPARIEALSVSRPVARPRAAAACHVGGVGRGDRGERRVVGQARGELVEERRDLLVVDVDELGEGLDRAADGGVHERVLGLRHVQQITGLVDDHEPVAAAERLGQRRRDAHDTIATEDDRLARLEAAQLLRDRCTHRLHRTGRA